MRSDSQFEGYTHGGSKDFHEDFMVSGDVGRLDEAGRLFVVGRDDEMIVSGGENVHPLEVEESLSAHDAVRRGRGARGGRREVRSAAGRPSSCWPTAARRQPRGPQGAREARSWPAYKVPREVTLLDELPRNASGKVVKRGWSRTTGS